MAQNSINLDPAVKSLNRIIDSASNISSNFLIRRNNCDDVCPPKDECPSSCILTIHKDALVGERIIVPFKIKNKHQNTRAYQIGVRPLVDSHGQSAPQQPTLNLNHVTLQPMQSRLIHMTIDLQNYRTGATYQTDIVIREDKYNQNICFTLCIIGDCNVPTAHPWDEKLANIKWLGWKRHFMCTPKDRKETNYSSNIEIIDVKS
jgi:hypothetical protein